MRTQYVFISLGILFGLLALFFLGRSIRSRVVRDLWPAACWACLSAGMLLQGLAPNLEIYKQGRGYFVIPQEMLNLPAAELIDRERRMKVASAGLTIAGCVGLIMIYRGAMFQSRAKV